MANHCIGAGPRLQLLAQDSALNNRVAGSAVHPPQKS